MRLFLDTASIDEVRDVVRMGILSGVTTNPTLMAKESGVSYRERVVEICETVKGPVSAECVSRELAELLVEARDVASWHPNVVVKIPIDEMGLEATSVLSREGIKINMTLIFSANQALLAASLRHPRHVIAAAQAGAPIATVPYAVIKAMIKHPLTDVGIERFAADARTYPRESARERANP